MNRIFTVVLLALLLAACGPAPVTQGPAITDTAAPETPQPATQTPAAATDTPAAMPDTPTPPPPSAGPQFLAYIYNGQLLVTDVTNGLVAGTTQYTVEGMSDKVTDLAWSPDGQFVAFTSAAHGAPHLFYIYAQGASTPTDLGPGSSPAWSPDSKSIAYIGGTYPDENIWLTTIDPPSAKPLSAETNHAWGRPQFTPDGTSLIVTTTDRNDMGAQGNTTVQLQQMPLDGSGTRTSLGGATPLEGVRMPYDLRFSPDGSKFAFSTSGHLSACASPGGYYVSDIAGTRQELKSPSLYAASDTIRERYYEWLGYAWMPSGDAIVATGIVMDCDPNSASTGQAVAVPQMSILKLDGSEGLIIPGMFYSLSVDRSGRMIAAAHMKDISDPNAMVEIYSAQDGKLMTKVGPGSNPQFQP